MTIRLKATVLLFGLILILTSTHNAQGQQVTAPTSKAEWLHHIKQVSQKYKMDPNDMAAVAEAEGSKYGYRWWFGRVGKYYLPWGIHYYVIKERGWGVWDWRVQTEVAIRALAYHKRKRGNFLFGLRCYNKSCTSDYINHVISLARKNRGDRIFEP